MNFSVVFAVAFGVLVSFASAGYLGYAGLYGAPLLPYAPYGLPVGRAWTYGSVVKHGYGLGYGLGYAKPLLGYGYGYSPLLLKK